MTTDQFRNEYHLLDRVSTGAVETYHAQAAAGAMVMVHFLRGDDTANRRVLDAIERLRPEPREKVLRIADVDDSTVVVTRFILDLDSFEDWLEAGAEPMVAQPDKAAESDGAGPGEFTRMFAALSSETPSPPDRDVPTPDDPEPRPPVREVPPPADEPPPPREEPPPGDEPAPPMEAPPPDEPGEFTRMFGAVTPPDHAVDPAAEPDVAQAPGEFTRMFAAAEPPPASAPSEPRTTPARPPEAHVQDPARPPEAHVQNSPRPALPVQPTPPASRPPSQPAPPPAHGPGEFTAMFGAPARPADMPEPAVPKPPPAPQPPAQTPPPGPSAAQPSPAAAPPASPTPQPGEYTKMFGASGASPQPPRPAPLRDVAPTDDYLSRLAGGSHSSARQNPLQPPSPAPSHSPQPLQTGGPSEFTRVISAMPDPAVSGQPRSLPQPPRTPSPAPTPTAPSSRWLAIGIGAVVVAAVLFVVLIAVIGR